MRNSLCSFIGLSFTLLFSRNCEAAVTVDYRNHDSQEHVFQAVCSGNKSSITFRRGTTGASTLQGSAPCIVDTPKGKVTLNGGEDVEIKDAEIKIM